jgi:hypothetical protein
LIWFIWLIRLVWFNQLNKTNQINETDQTDQMNRPPGGLFSILLTQRRVNPVAHVVRDRNYADADDDMLRDDLPSRDLLGSRQEIA